MDAATEQYTLADRAINPSAQDYFDSLEKKIMGKMMVNPSLVEVKSIMPNTESRMGKLYSGGMNHK